MFYQGNRSFFALRLSAIGTQIGVFLLLTHYCRGQSQMVGPPGSLLAMVGEDIILPCQVKPARNVISNVLEWARPDLNPQFVHLRQDEVDQLHSLNPLYEGRTSLSTESLKLGDISLKLSKVKVSDEGKYRCNIPDVGHAMVQLFVGAASSPAIVSIDRTSSGAGVVLQCESAGWYPEPEVLWLDAEGNLLSAGPPETVRGPDDLYTVSSRVTVDKRHSNSFTCRVQQNNINQTREAHIHVGDDFFSSSSSSAVPINTGLAVSLAVSIMVILAGVFFVWRQNTTITKKRTGDDAERGQKLLTEETVTQMVFRPRNTKTKDVTEKYEKIEEELQKTKEELKNKTEEMSLQLENKTEEVDKLMGDNKKLEQEKQQLQKIKDELENQAAASKSSLLSWLSLNSNKQQKKEVEPVKQEEIDQQEAELKWRKISEELENKRVELENKTAKLEQTERHVDELRTENENLKEEKQLLQKENEAMKIVKDELKNQIEKQLKYEKDHVEKFQKDIEELTNKNTEWEKKLIEEKIKRETAENKLEALRKKLNIESEEIKPEQTHLHHSLTKQNNSSSDSQETSGDITVEVDPDCNYICLRNMSDQDKPLRGHQLKVQINNRKTITYTFAESMEVKTRESVTLWRPGCGRHNPSTGDLVWKDLKSWKSGDRVQATLQ